ncbi:MAG TPA: Crp/Fnr family transcriptional regulator [Candidatus Sulfotelmatobacter sp.]|nr:Crp/Fnr family transcriptional regulator [Candidatus Sulfotelmatobacter sp.]
MPQLKKVTTLGSSIPVRSDDPPIFGRTRRCRALENINPHAGQRIPPAPALADLTNAFVPLQNLNRAVDEIDPLYLFATYVEWERSEEPSAAWELIAAARSSHCDTRAHARALLSSAREFGGSGLSAPQEFTAATEQITVEDEMKGPYGLEINDNCVECTSLNSGFYCQFSQPVLEALNQVSHKSTLPAGAILFVEGQASRGMFIVCSGKVHLSTTSREGKILILKTALAGEALGLSAAVSGMPYEATAVAATPCQVSFVERKHFMELIEVHSELGMHTSQCLSREYRSAYRDIHDLVLTRSSSGKLARLLLLESIRRVNTIDNYAVTPMTHEEMAQRIGASRETVTRLLSDLRKKRLISLDGPTLVIRDRSGLEALAV